MTESEKMQIKGALRKCAKENENKITPTCYVVVSSVCRAGADRIEELEKELEVEKKLNAEIKARFVKCNTCTDDMKSKCLMFSENLCEGERCEELVDLMSLVSKSELEENLTKAKELIRDLLSVAIDYIDKEDKNYSFIVEAEQFINSEVEK